MLSWVFSVLHVADHTDIAHCAWMPPDVRVRRYEGNWQVDKFHGRGKFTTGQTGWTYSGDLEQDRPTEGELVEADGRRFKVTYDKTCAFICDNPNPKTKEPVPQSCVCM